MSDIWGGYDPYADPYNQQEDDMSFLFSLFGAPQYGDPELGMPGNSFSQRMTALKNIEGLIGIPITQLMGGGSTSGTGGPAPTMQDSYTRTVYGSNPQFADAFSAIDSGIDPQTVFAEMDNKRKEYGINFPEGSQELEDWRDRTFGVVRDYAFEATENKSKYEQAMSEYGGQGDTFKIGSKVYEGSPDINGFASQYDLMGAPDLDKLLGDVALQRARATNKGVTAHAGNPFLLPEADDGLQMDEYMAHQKRNPTGRSTGPDDKLLPVSQARASYAPDWEQNGQKKYAREVQSKANPFQEQMDRGYLKPKIEKARTNMIRSDANAEAMRKILAMRALLGA